MRKLVLLMIFADFHTHSNFSGDSNTPMEQMIEKAISLGLKHLCITDHMDYDFPLEAGISFEFDPKLYSSHLNQIKEHYKKQIHISKGIELGLGSHLSHRYTELLNNYDFDFIIGSSHLVNGKDPYSSSYWEGMSIETAIHLYFQNIIENIKSFSMFQVYGHLDYAIRYIPDKNYHYSYMQYKDSIDEILTLLIHLGKGIEVNTSGYRYNLGFPHPHPDILSRYKSLGGEIITIGSDGHKPEHLQYSFHEVEQLLLSLGYKYYTTFEKQIPTFHPLGSSNF